MVAEGGFRADLFSASTWCGSRYRRCVSDGRTSRCSFDTTSSCSGATTTTRDRSRSSRPPCGSCKLSAGRATYADFVNFVERLVVLSTGRTVTTDNVRFQLDEHMAFVTQAAPLDSRSLDPRSAPSARRRGPPGREARRGRSPRSEAGAAVVQRAPAARRPETRRASSADESAEECQGEPRPGRQAARRQPAHAVHQARRARNRVAPSLESVPRNGAEPARRTRGHNSVGVQAAARRSVSNASHLEGMSVPKCEGPCTDGGGIRPARALLPRAAWNRCSLER